MVTAVTGVDQLWPWSVERSSCSGVCGQGEMVGGWIHAARSRYQGPGPVQAAIRRPHGFHHSGRRSVSRDSEPIEDAVRREREPLIARGEVRPAGADGQREWNLLPGLTSVE